MIKVCNQQYIQHLELMRGGCHLFPLSLSLPVFYLHKNHFDHQYIQFSGFNQSFLIKTNEWHCLAQRLFIQKMNNVQFSHDIAHFGLKLFNNPFKFKWAWFIFNSFLQINFGYCFKNSISIVISIKISSVWKTITSAFDTNAIIANEHSNQITPSQCIWIVWWNIAPMHCDSVNVENICLLCVASLDFGILKISLNAFCVQVMILRVNVVELNRRENIGVYMVWESTHNITSCSTIRMKTMESSHADVQCTQTHTHTIHNGMIIRKTSNRLH